jgi:hypothetical protein
VTRFDLIDQFPGTIISGVVYNDYPGILHFIGKSKTENEDLHDWQSKQDQQGFTITEYVSKFFS